MSKSGTKYPPTNFGAPNISNISPPGKTWTLVRYEIILKYLICYPATSVHINLNQIPSYSTNQHNLGKYIRAENFRIVDIEINS